MILPKLSSSCFVSDSWVPDRKHDNSSGIVHIPTMAVGDVEIADSSTFMLRGKFELNNVVAVPLRAHFSCHKHGKTCNDDSTSFPCSPRMAALLVQGKTGGKAHSKLGSATSAKIKF